MAEIKWIKITTNMFDDEKIKLIDAMPDRDTIHYIWVRLLVQAGKTNANGYIFLNENVPYTEEMLSTIFNRQISSVRLALQTLKAFGMIEISENHLIKISNWEKHQNVEGMERVREQTRNRVANHRAKKKEIVAPAMEEICGDVTNSNVTLQVTQSNAIEQEQEEERDKEEDKEEEGEREEEREQNSGCHDSLFEVLDFYQKAGFGFPSPIRQEEVSVDIDMYGPQWVIEALAISQRAGKYRYDYVRGILENWKRDGKDSKKKNNNQYNKNVQAGLEILKKVEEEENLGGGKSVWEA